MKRITHLACAAVFGLAAFASGSVHAAEEAAFIHATDTVAQTITLGNDSGTNGTTYHVTASSQISGPYGPMTLAELPSLAAGSDFILVFAAFETVPTSSGEAIDWLTLSEPVDQ